MDFIETDSEEFEIEQPQPKPPKKDCGAAVVQHGAGVLLPNGKTMFLFNYYRSSWVENSFKKCALRIGDLKDILSYAESISLGGLGPAEQLNLKDLSLGDDFPIMIMGRPFKRLDFKKFVYNKFKRGYAFDVFIDKVLGKFSDNFENINIKDYDNFEEGRWYIWEKPKRTKRPYGRVIY